MCPLETDRHAARCDCLPAVTRSARHVTGDSHTDGRDGDGNVPDVRGTMAEFQFIRLDFGLRAQFFLGLNQRRMYLLGKRTLLGGVLETADFT